MTLPASFTKAGYTDIGHFKRPRRVMIGCEGLSDTGKSEFALSSPGPGVWLCLDRNYEALLDNANPPAARNPDFALVPIKVPLVGQEKQEGFVEYWKAFYKSYTTALDLPITDCRTVIIDGDSDSYELQRLATFGRLEQVPPLMYTKVNAERRAMYARAHDSGKNIIATNKVKRTYKDILLADGTKKKDGKGNVERAWDGVSLDRQGFADQDYLWHIQLRHLFNPTKQEWGIRILKCKADPSLVGEELWGDECNFATLVQSVYPHVSLDEWGL